MKKMLGKIKSVHIGFGGYQEEQLGISFILGGDGWGVSAGDFRAWGMERSEDTSWTEEDRIKKLGETFLQICEWLKAAKVKDVYELKGIPVECTFDGTLLKEWRILAEVL